MQKIVYPNFRKNSILLNSKNSVSTLLIPENYVSFFLVKQRKYGGKIGDYLSYLLDRFGYSFLNELESKNRMINTAYQKKDLKLKKFGFTPKPEDWALLKMMKIQSGFSICAIFVFLLFLDKIGFGQILSRFGDGVPKLKDLLMSIKLFLKYETKQWILKYRQKKREHT